MNRPRKINKHLPACVYQKHGAYFYVKGGKWTHLGSNLGAALAEYSRIITDAQAVVGLSPIINTALERAAERVKPGTLAQYLTAQRIDDVLKIRLSNISGQRLIFQPKKTTSKEGEGKQILIVMTPEIKEVITAARSLHGQVTRIYLFGLRKGGNVRSYRGVKDQFDRATKKACIEDAHLHDLRAKALTDAKRQGLDAQTLALHTTEAMTSRYIRDRETPAVKGPSFIRLIDSKKKAIEKQ